MSLGMQEQWVHSHTFVAALVRLRAISEVHAGQFRRWADRVGLVLALKSLPYLQMALTPLPNPTFLRGCLKAYCVIEASPPPKKNTFGPTEGQNEQWREADRRHQRQTT